MAVNTMGKKKKKEIIILVFIGKKNVNFEETKCKRTREFPRSDGKGDRGPYKYWEKGPKLNHKCNDGQIISLHILYY